MTSIIIQTKQETTKVMLEDLYFIRSHPSKPHYVQAVTEQMKFDFLHKLQDLEVLYDEDLVRCHKNCLVNTAKIKSINLKNRTLSLGENSQYEITFSRRRYKYLLQKWLQKGEK